MRNLKSYKVFESKFVSKDEVDELLDKISSSGITSLTDIDKNRLTLFNEGDKEIINIIDKMGDLTLQFKALNKEMNRLSSEGKNKEAHSLMTHWMELNDKLRPLEQSFRKWGIELGDERLSLLMKRERPDAYNSELFESIKLVKKRKTKKEAKTDVYDVHKSGIVIGQIKWSSRNRGYAFLPTPDCEPEIKEFIKNLMAERRAKKKKKS